MTKHEIFEVGGCVRDEVMRRKSHDIDFSVVVNGDFPDAMSGFATMIRDLDIEGFRFFKVDCDTFTVRGQFPKGHAQHGKTTADFVMARIDGPSTDKRHPDFVLLGTLKDDLDRRDFRMNAIAKAADGSLIDPHNGVRDIQERVIRAVGNPLDRFLDDALRPLRALRFSIVLGFTIAADVMEAMHDPRVVDMIANMRKLDNRKRDELEKMFAADTLGSLRLIGSLSDSLQDAIFSGDLRLSATLKK